MKRSIVQQGPTTLMISLPIKWVRKYNLSKGNELDIEEVGNKLTVSTAKKTKQSNTQIKIECADELYIWRCLQPLYISGYDEIKVYFNSTKTLDIIQDLVISSLMGYEMIHQEKDYCIIKSVSTELDEQFSNILRKVFLNILQMSEITLDYLQKGKNPSTILNLELMNNRHTMFLKRMLIKEGYDDLKKIPFAYSLVVFLEKIANEYKFFVWYVDNKKIRISKEMSMYYKKIHNEIQHIYDVFYSYDSQKVKNVIMDDIRVEYIKPLMKQDPEIAYYFMKITDLIRTCLFQIMGIKQK